MPTLSLPKFESSSLSQSDNDPERLPPQQVVQDLLSQLELDKIIHPKFQEGRQWACIGQGMRAIQDCSIPFDFGARVSRSGRYLKFNHAGLRSLRIPATLSTKILVEDPENNSDEIRFDIRSGSGGMYNLMRWLVQKARAHEARIFRRQRKSSHRTGSAKRPVSRVRQRLAVKVLIRNAKRVKLELLQKSDELFE